MTGPRPKTSRPRDRKQQIVAAASEQFRTQGYHNVGMAGIAEAVGISGPALYRHFSGKQELLYATLASAVDQLAEAFRGAHGDRDGSLDAFAAAMLQAPHDGLLWERDLTHLPQDQRDELRARYVAAIAPLRAAIAASRPDLPAHSVDLLLRVTLAVFGAISGRAAKADPARVRPLMTEVGTAVCMTPHLPSAVGAAEPPVSRGKLLPVTRREAVLAVATRLFAERGYEAVGMEDIAAGAAGLAGPSLYHHFPGKSAILVAALIRCLEALLFDLAAALDLAAEPGEALDVALRSFVRISIEHGSAMSALLHEIGNVPAEERQAVRRMQSDYVTEWTALLTAHRPGLPAAEARLLVHAAQSAVTALRQRSPLWPRPGSRAEMIFFGRLVLGLPQDSAASG